MVNVVTLPNLGSEFDIGVLVASKISVVNAADTVKGKVALSVGANYPADNTANNDVDATTPLYVKNAIAAAQPTAATDTVSGKVALSVGANYPADNTANNDVDATTPLYVKNAIAGNLSVVLNDAFGVLLGHIAP